MPLSVWNKLSLPNLSPTYMTLELADRSISRPVGVAEDVYVKVGTFHFSTDFVVVDFDADPRVPLILGRSFLKTGRDLIDVFEGELTLRVGKEAITFNLDLTSRYSANYNGMTAKRIDVIDMACEEYFQEVLGFSDVITKVDAFLALEDYPTSSKVDQSYLDSEGDILLLEAFLNDDPSLPPPNQENYLPEVRKELKICEAKSDKSSIDEPPEEKTTFTCPYGTFAYSRIPFGLCNAPGAFQRCMMAIFNDMIEKTMEVFMDDFSVFGNSFQSCLSHLEKMLKRYEDTNLCLNWEKSHFMVKEGIVLGNKISKQGIEVYKAKVDVITKLPHPTTVKASILIAPDWDMPFELMYDASDFAIGAVLGQRQEKHFRPIHYASKTMTEAESNYTTTEKEMLAMMYAFEKFRSYLIANKSIEYTDHSALKYLFAKKDSKARLLHWVLLLQEFTFKVIDKKRAENLATDHLSRLENPHQDVLDPKEINELFPIETLIWFLLMVTPVPHAYKIPIGCTPHKLVYGKACHLPIELEHKAHWALKHANFDLQTAGDHRKVQLNELRDQAYENSIIYKEKTKRLHDSRIKDRIFNIDDRVLLFNSQLKIFSGKLKSRWSGPFTIFHVYPYGAVELSQPDGPKFKVNGHRVKHYFGENVPNLVVPDLQIFLKDH
nr:DNA-directed DNA polymerase [Tanacetum cinerariifolium]